FKIKATTPGINTTAVAIRFQVILVSVLAACAYSASRGTIENSRQQPECRALCQQSTNVLEVLFCKAGHSKPNARKLSYSGSGSSFPRRAYRIPDVPLSNSAIPPFAFLIIHKRFKQ